MSSLESSQQHGADRAFEPGLPLPDLPSADPTPVVTHGTVTVFSALQAMTGAIQEAVETLVERCSCHDWKPQPIEPTLMRFATEWTGLTGTGETMASMLSSWPHIRFEVTEKVPGSGEAHVWTYTPDLGMFAARLNEQDKVLIRQERFAEIFRNGVAEAAALQAALTEFLGTPWEEELRCFRVADRQSECDMNIRWLSQP